MLLFLLTFLLVILFCVSAGFIIYAGLVAETRTWYELFCIILSSIIILALGAIVGIIRDKTLIEKYSTDVEITNYRIDTTVINNDTTYILNFERK